MAVGALYRFPVHGKRPFDPRPRRVRSIALEQKLNALRFSPHRDLGRMKFAGDAFGPET